MTERGVVFGASAPLVGVLTEPEAPEGGPAFVMLNSGLLHRVGPHRLYVELARALSMLGIPSLRFDFSGIGDSGPRTDQVPARLAAVEEAREAMDLLRERIGSQRFVLVGVCSGADAAFRTAVRDDRVVGTVMIDGLPYRSRRFFLRHYLGRLIRPSSWRNVLTGRHPLWNRLRPQGTSGRPGNGAPPPSLSDGRRWWPMPSDRDIPSTGEAHEMLETLLVRRVELCFVYTGGYSRFVNGARQFAEVFPDLDQRGRVMVERLADTDHTFTLGSHRQRLIRLVQAWCADAGWLNPSQAGAAGG